MQEQIGIYYTVKSSWAKAGFEVTGWDSLMQIHPAIAAKTCKYHMVYIPKLNSSSKSRIRGAPCLGFRISNMFFKSARVNLNQSPHHFRLLFFFFTDLALGAEEDAGVSVGFPFPCLPRRFLAGAVFSGSVLLRPGRKRVLGRWGGERQGYIGHSHGDKHWYVRAVNYCKWGVVMAQLETSQR